MVKAIGIWYGRNQLCCHGIAKTAGGDDLMLPHSPSPGCATLIIVRHANWQTHKRGRGRHKALPHTHPERGFPLRRPPRRVVTIPPLSGRLRGVLPHLRVSPHPTLPCPFCYNT